MRAIYNHREIIGYAQTIAQAKRIISKAITIPNGFNLQVFERNTELTGLPSGFVYSVSYAYK
jgi:hypothetical protein